MFRTKLGKKAQTTAEYAILFALVVGAVVAMQIYVKRGIQGRVRDVVDHTGSGGEVAGQTLEFTASQYEPYYTQSTASTTQSSTSTEQMTAGGGTSRDATSDVTVTREATVTAGE
ncbi:MAG: hypothetical protein FJZ13_04155 [Candidatus Omnitrophica bacterium]|nr:hypothetical protein [Candidatus Omnitrophota bacterium]